MELPHGVLATPRLLSNFSDAPMLGEAAILWQLSIQPEKGFRVTTGGSIPGYVYIVFVSVFLFGAWRILEAIWTFRDARRPPEPAVWAPRFQISAWACFRLGAMPALWSGHGIIGTIVLIVAVMLPVVKRRKASKGDEDWAKAKASPAAKPDKDWSHPLCRIK